MKKGANNKHVLTGPFNNDVGKAEYISNGHGIKRTARICAFAQIVYFYKAESNVHFSKITLQ